MKNFLIIMLFFFCLSIYGQEQKFKEIYNFSDQDLVVKIYLNLEDDSLYYSSKKISTGADIKRYTLLEVGPFKSDSIYIDYNLKSLIAPLEIKTENIKYLYFLHYVGVIKK